MTGGPVLLDSWSELSTFYKSLLKGVTYSDLDRPAAGPICYAYTGRKDQPQEKHDDGDEEEEEEEEIEDEEQLQQAQENGLDFVPLIFQSLFYICTRTAEVKMPSGNVDKPVVEDNRDGTVSIKYEPREEGTHEVYVKYNGEHVQGSPFKFHVDSLASGYVTAYGPGLIYGVCGEPGNFTISTKGAGAGGLSMAVEGPSKAEISCHDNKDGTVSVSYLPTAPGEYKISVKFGDKHIKGSPYLAKITASSM